MDNALPVYRTWTRLDTKGTEHCCLTRVGDLWHLSGAVSVEAEEAQLHYEITCDADWVTKTARITGWMQGSPVQLQVTRDAQGQWWCNDHALPELSGCVDIDLGFTPATNTLPIRRLRPSVGETVTVTAAWLRFPALTFSALPQRYTALGHDMYRYESANGGFTALLSVDTQALVRDYGDIWQAE